MQIVSSGDNLHEIKNLFSGGKKKENILICRQLKLLYRDGSFTFCLEMAHSQCWFLKWFLTLFIIIDEQKKKAGVG